MKTTTSFFAAVALFAQAIHSAGQSTAFTYQGRLSEGGAAANGTYDLKFTLYDSLNGAGVVAGPITNKPITLSNGLFTTQLDFGVAPFNGASRWLEIGVRTNGSATGHTTLAPRQPLTPAPSAIHAMRASDIQPGANLVFTGTAAFAPPGGPPFAVGSTITVPNLSADFFDGLDSAAFWKLSGNPGSPPGPRLLSTFDNEPLEFHVGNQRALRLEPNLTSPSIIAGFPGNIMGGGVAGGVIAGGGSATAPNNVFGNYCAVPGGQGNTANGDCSTAIGFRSTASGIAATAIGWQAVANGTAATSIGDNTLAQDNSIAAGTRAKATQPGCFVWADTQSGDFTATAANQFLMRAANGVGINTANPGAMLQVGDATTLNSQGMIRLASHSGTGPATRWWDIGVPEGDENVSGKFYSFVIDDPQHGSEPEITVRWDTGNVGIGTAMPEQPLHLNVTAGEGMRIDSSILGHAPAIYLNNTAIGGRNFRIASYNGGFFPGSFVIRDDTAGADRFSIGAGGTVRAEIGSGQKLSLGGNGNFEIDAPGIVAGRFVVTDAGDVGIGVPSPGHSLDVRDSQAVGRFTTTSAANGSVIELRNTGAGSPGAINFNNSGGTTPGQIAYTAADQMTFRTAGSTRMTLDAAGNLFISGSYFPPSDRNKKSGFKTVDAKEILEKVVALPITRWHYTNDATTPHIGPVAQDFHAAFNLGMDDKHIATVDADGVALAAIQGLNQKLEDEMKRSRDKDAEIQSLKEELTEIKEALRQLTSQRN